MSNFLQEKYHVRKRMTEEIVEIKTKLGDTTQNIYSFLHYKYCPLIVKTLRPQSTEEQVYVINVIFDFSTEWDFSFYCNVSTICIHNAITEFLTTLENAVNSMNIDCTFHDDYKPRHWIQDLLLDFTNIYNADNPFKEGNLEECENTDKSSPKHTE